MIDAATRAQVRQRAGDRCEYCRLHQKHSTLVFQIEHVIAKQHGGSDEWMNLALACDRCNLYKGTNLSGVDPVSNEITLLFNPRLQTWSDHFATEHANIFGLTAAGRATVRLLNMNVARRLSLRTALLENGELDF